MSGEVLKNPDVDTGAGESGSPLTIDGARARTLLLIDAKSPVFNSTLFDPNEVIRDFTAYLENLGSRSGRVIPILKMSSANHSSKSRSTQVKYSDPIGNMREYLGTSDLDNDKRQEKIDALFKKGVIVSLGGNPEQAVSFYFENIDEIELAHIKGYITKHALLLEATYNKIHNAYVDEMTGLASKNVFTRLEDETGFDMDYFDLSGFKIFNDLYGHALGDDALRFFAKALAECSHKRSGDQLIHKGGDEFIRLRKNRSDTSHHTSENIKEELNTYLQTHPFIFDYIDIKGVHHENQKVYLEAHVNSAKSDGKTPLKDTLSVLSKTAKTKAQLLSAIQRIFRDTELARDILEYAEAMFSRLAEIPEGRKMFIEKAITFLDRKRTMLTLLKENTDVAQMLWEDLKRELGGLQYGEVFHELLANHLGQNSEIGEISINEMISHIERSLTFLNLSIEKDTVLV